MVEILAICGSLASIAGLGISIYILIKTRNKKK